MSRAPGPANRAPSVFVRASIPLMLAAVLAVGGVHPMPAMAQDAAAPHVVSEFDGAFKPTYSFLSWKDKVQVTDGRLVFKGMKSDGGIGVVGPMNLAAYGNRTPVLRLKTTAANTAKLIGFNVQDSAGHVASWRFPLPAPSDDFVAVVPMGGASLKNPIAFTDTPPPEKPGPVDLADIYQFQLLGDWQNGTFDLEIDALQLVAPNAKITAAREAYTKEQTGRLPEVKLVSLVAPDILSIVIKAQRVVPVQFGKYVPAEGDEKKPQKRPDGTVIQADLIREGTRIGRLLGPKLDWFATDERMEGDRLLTFHADEPANYTVRSDDDPAFSGGFKPLAVYRKTVPRDVVLPHSGYVTRHRVYLKLPSPVTGGKTYSIKVDNVNVSSGQLTFAADLPRTLSESVHVNQIGYRPDDPIKRAFLSVWLGTGGAYSFAEGMNFSLIDESSNQPAFSGKVERVLKIDEKEDLWVKPKNYSGTAVYRMDFSAFKTPGKYRVYVEGVGCSYPFEIGPRVWEHAFLTQMKGLYKQRSGVEVGPPYSEFRKPRDFHPDDGLVVTRSTYDVLKQGPDAFADMPKGDTGEVVKDAWGGYHDAGDWNPRRATHMHVTMAQLEIYELFPDYFKKLKLSIPPTEGIPDVITEALFEIDCFRRLQLPSGAVPHGIETEGDPGFGEVSWLSTQKAYVLAPNIRDTWLYAAAAGRVAKVLTPIKPELAKVYLESAERAHVWAEAEYAKLTADGKEPERAKYWESFDARVISSVVLYDVTGKQPYHDAFKASAEIRKPDAEVAGWEWAMQSDATFLYARMDEAKTDPAFRKSARDTVIRLAERSLKYGNGNAFNLTQRERGRPMFAGFFTLAGGTELVRAHYLTGKPEYLAGAVQSCQFQSGCNPNNIVYTTGLGANPVKVPLELDARSSGQPVPPGLTVWGNTDYYNFPNSFWDINLKYVNRPENIWPDAYQWPLSEAYWEAWVLVSANEYTTDSWGANLLVWGYLAARPQVAAH